MDRWVSWKKYMIFPIWRRIIHLSVCGWQLTLQHLSVFMIQKIDVIISKRLIDTKLWDGGYIKLIKEALATDLEMELIDCRANIGVYSLSAAAMERKVLSIEPIEENLQRILKEIRMGHFEDRVLVVHKHIEQYTSHGSNPNK